MVYSAAVVIPLYKESPNIIDEISIQQCLSVLSKHPIIAIKPNHLTLEKYNFKFDEVVSFDNEYFADFSGYNKLMMSGFFYEKFLNYKHILIYQTDAVVFKDELDYWCKQGYDYIGAPWLIAKPYPDIIKDLKSRIINHLQIRRNTKEPGTDLPIRSQLNNRVGNGGFSLRNTKKFYDICRTDIEMIEYYNTRSEHQFGEDVYWSIEVNRKHKRLNVPNYKVASHFAMENCIDHAFKITKGKLPFGCHAWDRNLNIWKPIFNDQGIPMPTIQ